jgi:Ca2+-transporting ATPase
MFMLLIGASAAYFLLGDLEEAIVLSASIGGDRARVFAVERPAVVITGDYPVTASATARAAGLPNAGDVGTGPQLAAMSDAEPAPRLPSATVFARRVPTRKLRLVQALSASGEVVAMTGDGGNDAPALKA